jgi:hypothetical protein
MASRFISVFASAAAVALACVAGCDAELTRPSLYNQVEVSVMAGDEPVPGARIILYTGARPMGFAETGADGRYTFRRVPQNNYGVIIAPIPAGYDTISRGPDQKPANVVDGLDVSGSKTIEVEFLLKKL